MLERVWSNGLSWDHPNLEYSALHGGLMFHPFYCHVTIQPRLHIYTFKTHKLVFGLVEIGLSTIWHLLRWCVLPSLPGVLWIT